jgi:hypothetical protein
VHPAGRTARIDGRHTPQEPVLKNAPVFAVFAATATLVISALALPSRATAAGPELRIPDFSHLHGKAIEAVDITIDGFLLRTLSKIAQSNNDSDDAEEAAALQVLGNLKSVQIRTFRFDVDGAYDAADIDAVRRQLSAPGWSALVQTHKREPREDVDVYIKTEGGKVQGLAVVASEPREFTIVNVIGSIDIDKLAKLEGQFGIPRVSRNE